MPKLLHQENGFEFFVSTDDSLYPLVYVLRNEGFVKVHLGKPGFVLPFIIAYANLSPGEVEGVWECVTRNQAWFMTEWEAIHGTPKRLK